MVLKRKLPTQIAQEEKDKEAQGASASGGESKTDAPAAGGDEPWVFSGNEADKDAGKSDTPEKSAEEPAPWSMDSLDGGSKKAEEPTKEAPAESATPAASSSSVGDYPWAISNTKSQGDTWSLNDSEAKAPEVAAEDDGAKPPLAPANDIYAGISGGKKEDKGAAAGMPPWATVGGSGGSGDKMPPILPEAAGGKSGGGLFKSLIILAVVGGVFAGGYIALFKKRDEVAEVTARWTGTLNEISQEIESVTEGDPEPEDIIAFNPVGSAKKPEKKDEEATKEPEAEVVVQEEPKKAEETQQVSNGKTEPTTQVDFVDVDKKEADEPITADEETEMPKDLSLFASLQAAIMKEKEEKRTKDMAKVTEDAPEVDPETLSEEEKMIIGQKLRKQTNDKMEDYIQTLTEIKNPALKPKPSEFFENPEKYKKRAENYRAGRSLDEEKVTYNSNPKNLPVIPEPTVPVKPGVRTLADFKGQVFEPERDKVRIPRHLKPKMGAAGFPSLEILSLVPHKGIIAFARGKEGILMIGDRIEGWELTAVREEYAEFHNGNRKHIVSIDVIR